NISGTFAVASLVSFRNGRPDRANYRRFRIKTVEGQDDFASVAEVVRRRYTRVLNESKVQSPELKAEEPEQGKAVPEELQKAINEVSIAVRRGRPAKPVSIVQPPSSSPRSPGLPDLILIDGGKGQLSAACEELKKLGLSHIPIIG